MEGERCHDADGYSTWYCGSVTFLLYSALCWMDSTPTDELMVLVDDADLGRRLTSLIDVGEVPYQANRKVVRAVDVNRDMAVAERELKVLLAGLDAWVEELKEFEDAARTLAKGAALVRAA